MKNIILFASGLLLSISNLSFDGSSTEADPQELIGMWKLDMTPHIPDDNQFAIMEISKIKDNAFKGTFYREGVKIQNGQLNTSTGRIYGALISGDNSGSYNTSFYFENGKLYGSTHAIERNFLSVWVATKEE
jgi:hypothetical protein